MKFLIPLGPGELPTFEHVAGHFLLAGEQLLEVAEGALVVGEVYLQPSVFLQLHHAAALFPPSLKLADVLGLARREVGCRLQHL